MHTSDMCPPMSPSVWDINHGVFENAGTENGFSGCIYKLQLGQRLIELHEGRDTQVVQVFKVRECGFNPCANLPCTHGGSCSVTSPDKYSCLCSQDFTGQNCENHLNPCSSNPCASGSTCEVLPQAGFICKCGPGHSGKVCQILDPPLNEVFVPEFNGSTFLKLPRLEGVGRTFSIEMWFLSRSPDGILFYNGQMPNGKGDFISLELVNGHLQFQYDLGSGPANITSDEEIVLGQWHSVKVSRVDREGTLQLDKGKVASGESDSPLVELNLELPLYIGGIPSRENMSAGLDGAVQRFLVNGHTISSFKDSGMPQWTGPPCSENKCLHGGICQPELQDFTCICLQPYKGKYCEAGDSKRPVKFDGKTFYSFPVITNKEDNFSINFNETAVNLENMREESMQMENETYGEHDMYDENGDQFFGRISSREQRLSYQLVFRTMEPNSLLLWLSNDISETAEVFSLIISGGFVELHLTSDTKPTVKSKVYVSDGAWHTVTAHLSSLQVDSETPVRILTDVQYNQQTFNTMWIGGAAVLPPGLPPSYYLGFKGCLEDIKVSQQTIDLDLLGDASVVKDFCDENDV